jgi:hypothetical protein
VTWPEGNGFLVKQLRERVKDHIQSGTAVARVEQLDRKALLCCAVPNTKDSFAISADHVIFAAPRFIAKRIVNGAFVPADISYAPWLVANVSVSSVPHAKGIPLAWDNVNYHSDSLGYVVATHQDITTRESATVLTYYYPLSDKAPTAARKDLLESSAESWSSRIIADLEKMHPGIEEDIRSIDLWTWGHGMVRPSVGFIWGNDRKEMKRPLTNVIFAHSDMSGLSNFEEAQYHGVQAAKSILAKVAAT